MDDAYANDGHGGGIQGRDPRTPPQPDVGIRERSRSPGREREEKNPGNNLHVSGLSLKVDQNILEEAFAKAGRVSKVSIMFDPHTRESRGFGFVTMETAEEAAAAITALNGTDFLGKTVRVEKARRGRARTPTPGKYHGPPKRMLDDRRGGGGGRERQYDPRPYDSRYARDFDDRRGGGRYEERRYDDRRYEDRERDYERRDYDRRDYREDRRDYERDRYDYERRRY